MRPLLLLIAAACPVAAIAQNLPQISAPGSVVPPAGIAYTGPDGKTYIASPGTPLPVQTIDRSEAIQLISASVSAAPQTLVGGSYAFSQSCLNYNGATIALRYRGPDGTTMLTAATKGSADVSLVSVPAAAVVDAIVPSNAIGCNASITRIPQ